MLVKARGWRPGLITIELIQLIKDERGLGLIEARKLAHAIVDDEPINFEFDSAERGILFREKLESLGVKTED